MITKSDIKLINSLKRKSKRIEFNLFVVEGIKNVQELLNSNFKIFKLFTLEEEKSNFPNSIVVSEKELSRISHLKSPNKVLALVKIPNSKTGIIKYKTTLVIDTVKDPGNLGTIIRTADWFGISQIVCSKESVDCFNSKVIMATMGSIFRVNIEYKDLKLFLAETKLPVYGALLKGNSIYKTKFTSPCIFLMGNESKGISKQLIPYIDFATTIPREGNAESLNLGISTAIFCYEYVKSLKTSTIV